MEEDIVQLKFSFPIPSKKWIARFSVKFEDLQINLLSMLLLSKKQGSGLFQIQGGNKQHLDEFWKDFIEFYDTSKYTLIFRDETTILVNILSSDPWVLHTLMDAQFILLFPILIRNGSISIELIAPRNKIDLIFNNPEWKKVNISIKQIGSYCPDSLLSPRQSEILNNALQHGFFNIPRQTSLSELAEILKISPSALSENLRRINKKLAEHFLQYAK
ncbi:MAG: helix-turn-helix domain-containing protein [Promethearchaeota archaeon]